MLQQEIIDQDADQPYKGDRPTAITVICVLGFIGGAMAIPMTFSIAAKAVGSWYPPYLGVSCIIGFICMWGLWKMKKWAAYTYAAFALINQIILVSMGVWNVMALIIPAIVIAIAFTHIKKMD